MFSTQRRNPAATGRYRCDGVSEVRALLDGQRARRCKSNLRANSHRRIGHLPGTDFNVDLRNYDPRTSLLYWLNPRKRRSRLRDLAPSTRGLDNGRMSRLALEAAIGSSTARASSKPIGKAPCGRDTYTSSRASDQKRQCTGSPSRGPMTCRARSQRA